MKLWCGKQFVVGILCAGRIKSCNKGGNEARSRSSSISCKHHSRFDVCFDVQIARELVVDFQESLIGRRICKSCGICFPRTLRPLLERLNTFEMMYVVAIPRTSHPVSQISQCTRLPFTTPTIGSTSLTPLSSGGLWLAVIITPIVWPFNFFERKAASKPTR